MGEISQILDRISGGDASAVDDLLSLVYDELRRIAASKMQQEAVDNTLTTTALVHEAWMRLCHDGRMPQWNSRAHFFGAASEAMRRVLIDQARRRHTQKRGHGLQRLDIAQAEPLTMTDGRLLDLDEALQKLESEKPRVAQLVTLRFFGGLSIDEAAELLDIAPSTANSWWAYARAWLRQELSTEG